MQNLLAWFVFVRRSFWSSTMVSPGSRSVPCFGRSREVVAVLGCFITNHGIPSRSSGYIKWETKATSFAQRGGHVLLFSEQFIEIRNIATGVIVQVIEGTDIRLLHASPSYGDDDTVLIAMRGDKMDKDGTSDKIIELVETTEYGVTSPTIQTTPSTAIPAMWDEWDM
jgi:hypothetical protein